MPTSSERSKEQQTPSPTARAARETVTGSRWRVDPLSLPIAGATRGSHVAAEEAPVMDDPSIQSSASHEGATAKTRPWHRKAPANRSVFEPVPQSASDLGRAATLRTMRFRTLSRSASLLLLSGSARVTRDWTHPRHVRSLRESIRDREPSRWAGRSEPSRCSEDDSERSNVAPGFAPFPDDARPR